MQYETTPKSAETQQKPDAVLLKMNIEDALHELGPQLFAQDIVLVSGKTDYSWKDIPREIVLDLPEHIQSNDVLHLYFMTAKMRVIADIVIELSMTEDHLSGRASKDQLKERITTALLKKNVVLS
jgi:hypothetical protein